MATPGQFNYILDGQSVGFINSDDCKLQIRSFAPLVIEFNPGIVRPGTGSLAIDEQTPDTAGSPSPGTATLSLVGELLYEDVHLVLPLLGSLAYSGKVPTLLKTSFPSTGSLSIVEQSVERRTGLKLDTYKPSLLRADVVNPLLETLAFEGYKPNVINAVGAAHTMVPETGNLAVSGKLPISALVIPVPVGAIVAAGKTPNTNPVAYPAKASLTVSGGSLVVDDGIGNVTVIVEYRGEPGTLIRNLDAGPYEGKYNVDQRTGFKQKPGRLVKDAYGVWTRPDSADKIHPADLPHKVRTEKADGPLRPSDVGNEIFIDDPVDPDDY